MNIKDRVVSKPRFFAHLRALAASKKTGTLIVTEPGVERRLYFEQGAIVAGTSNLREESMGYLLAERDIVKANKVKQAEDLLGNKASLLGRRLVLLGAMSEDEIVNAVRLKVRETIANILASPEADVTLNDETFPDVDRVPVSIDVHQLLAAGIEAAEKKVTRRDSEETNRFGTSEETVVLEPEPEPEETLTLPPDDDPDSHLMQALEGFTEKYSREAGTGPRPVGPVTKPYAVVPGPRTGSHARPARKDRSPVGLIAAGVAGVALLGGGYWFLARSPQESATTVADRVVVPSATETEPTSEPAARVETGAEPVATAALENSQPVASARSAPPPARPSPAPVRESPPAPAARQAQPAPAVATPRQQVSAPPAPRQAPTTPPRVETSTPPVAAQREPAPEPPSKSSTAETERSEPGPPAPAPPATPPPPAEQPQQAQPAQTQQAQQAQEGAPGNWGSAVFAPKQASVGAAPKRDPGLQTGDYVEPSFDVIEPVLIEHPKLEYPEEAKRQKIPEAVVRVRVLVDHTGAVQDAEIVKGAGHGFDEVALAAAAQAKFIPATKGQVQVKTWTVLPLVFRLED
jgi:TonB family protein